MSPTVQTTSRFSLHDADKAGRSLLWVEGHPTDTRIRGCSLRMQFELPDAFVLIADYDDPWEEITEITLLDRSLRLIGNASLGGGGTGFARRTYQVQDIHWLDERNFVTVPTLPEHGQFQVEIRERWLPFVGSRLKVTKC